MGRPGRSAVNSGKIRTIIYILILINSTVDQTNKRKDNGILRKILSQME